MNRMLKTSLGLNLVLAAGLIWICMNHRPGRATVGLPAGTRTGSSTVATAVHAPTPQPPVAVPVFHWSQLDSKDYHVYVKNLRRIGCPEPTVRAIVTADVDSVYQIFEHQIEDTLAKAQNGSWSQQLATSGSEQALKDALQRLPDEEAAKIADLLGLKPFALPTRAALSPPPVVAVTEPLVMQDVNLSALNLSAAQQLAITGLKQDFLQQTGGTNQDANDPAYTTRWRKAQVVADDMLMTELGNQAFSQYQMLAYQKSLENH